MVLILVEYNFIVLLGLEFLKSINIIITEYIHNIWRAISQVFNCSSNIFIIKNNIVSSKILLLEKYFNYF